MLDTVSKYFTRINQFNPPAVRGRCCYRPRFICGETEELSGKKRRVSQLAFGILASESPHPTQGSHGPAGGEDT